jgi:hypothetical protein
VFDGCSFLLDVVMKEIDYFPKEILHIIDLMIRYDLITKEIIVEKSIVDKMLHYLQNGNDDIIDIVCTSIGRLTKWNIFTRVPIDFLLHYLETNINSDTSITVLWMMNMLINNDFIFNKLLEEGIISFLGELFKSSSFSARQRIVILFSHIIKLSRDNECEKIIESGLLLSVIPDFLSEDCANIAEDFIISFHTFLFNISDENRKRVIDHIHECITNDLLDDISTISPHEDYCCCVDQLRNMLSST